MKPFTNSFRLNLHIVKRLEYVSFTSTVAANTANFINIRLEKGVQNSAITRNTLFVLDVF